MLLVDSMFSFSLLNTNYLCLHGIYAPLIGHGTKIDRTKNF